MKKSKPPAVTSNARTLKVVAEPGKSREALIADAATRANVPVAAVIMDFSKPTWGELSLGDVLDSLNKHAGKIKGGRSIQYPENTPMTNLLLTMLDKAGVPAEKIGDSTGEVSHLSGV